MSNNDLIYIIKYILLEINNFDISIPKSEKEQFQNLSSQGKYGIIEER